jgi:hypothetical protein
LVLASKKLTELANFGAVSEIPLFENNQHYVKLGVVVSYSYLIRVCQRVSPSPTPLMDGR